MTTANSHHDVAQAEAKLAVQHQQPQTDVNQAAAWPDPFPRLDFDFNFSQPNTSGVDNGVMICSVGPDESLNPFANINFHDSMVAQAMNDTEW